MRVGLGAVLLCVTVLAHAEEALPPVPPEAIAFGMLLDTLDDRPSTETPRSSVDLIGQLAGLEHVLGRTAPTDPTRSEQLRRIAEDYVELRAASMREATKPYTSESAQARAMETWSAANDKAKSFYRQLLREYPDDAKSSEVRFFLALEVAERETHGKFQHALQDMFSKDSKSPLAPVAHFGYAELLRLDGEPARAAKEYLAITKYKGPNRVACLTRERLSRSALFLKLKVDDGDAFSETLACERNKRAKVR